MVMRGVRGGVLLVLGAVAVSACTNATGGTRTESRAVISGTVVLEDVPGLRDFSRVRVEIGRGEGGVTPDDTGAFEFSDVEPDVYTLAVIYAGGLTADAEGSAYKRLETRVVARAGDSINVGALRPQLGTGTVTGRVVVEPAPAGGDSAPAELEVLGPDGVVRTTPVGTDGTFTLSNVPVGRHTVKARVAAQAPAASSPAACGQEVTVSVDGEQVPSTEMGFARTEPSFVGGAGARQGRGLEWWTRAPTLSLRALTGAAAQSRTWAEGSVDGGLSAWSAFPEDGWSLPLPEGRTRQFFQFMDVCGQELGTWTVDLVRDEDAPAISDARVRALVGGLEGATNDPAVLLVVDAEDALSTTLTMATATCPADMAAACDQDVLTAPELPLARTSTLLLPETDGDYVVAVVVRDLVGNASVPWHAPVLLNRQLPSAALALLEPDGRNVVDAATRQRTLRVSLSALQNVRLAGLSPGASCTGLALSAVTGTTWEGVTTLAGADGMQTVTVCVDNGAGLRVPLSAATLLDTTPPSTPRLGDLPAVVNTDPRVELAVPAIDAAGAVTYALDINGAVTPWDGVARPLGQADGEHTVRVRAVDAAGNMSQEDELEVTVDRVAPLPPTVTQFSSLGRDALLSWATGADTVRVHVFYDRALTAASDAPAELAAAMQGNALSNGPSPFTVERASQVRLIGLPEGALYVALAAEDGAGNVGPPSAPLRVEGGVLGLEVAGVVGSPRTGVLRGMPGTSRVLLGRGAAVEVAALGPESAAPVAQSLVTVPTLPSLGLLATPTAGTYLEWNNQAYAAFAVPQRQGLRRWGDVMLVRLGPASTPALWKAELVRTMHAVGSVTDVQAVADADTVTLAWVERAQAPERAHLSWVHGLDAPQKRLEFNRDDRALGDRTPSMKVNLDQGVLGGAVPPAADAVLVLSNPGSATLHVAGCDATRLVVTCFHETCDAPTILSITVDLATGVRTDRVTAPGTLPQRACGLGFGTTQQPTGTGTGHVLPVLFRARGADATTDCQAPRTACSYVDTDSSSADFRQEPADGPLRAGGTLVHVRADGTRGNAALLPDRVATALMESPTVAAGVTFQPGAAPQLRPLRVDFSSTTPVPVHGTGVTLSASRAGATVAALDVALLRGTGTRLVTSAARGGGGVEGAVVSTAGTPSFTGLDVAAPDLPDVSSPRATALVRGYAYVATGEGGITVHDLGDALRPREVARIILPGENRAEDVVRIRDRVFGVGPDGLVEVDTTLPWAPVRVALHDLPGPVQAGGVPTSFRLHAVHGEPPVLLVSFRWAGSMADRAVTHVLRLQVGSGAWLGPVASVPTLATAVDTLVQLDHALVTVSPDFLRARYLVDNVTAGAGPVIPEEADTASPFQRYWLTVAAAGHGVVSLGQNANQPAFITSSVGGAIEERNVAWPGSMLRATWGAAQAQSLVFVPTAGGTWVSPMVVGDEHVTGILDHVTSPPRVLAAIPTVVRQVVEEEHLVLGVSAASGVIALAAPAASTLQARTVMAGDAARRLEVNPGAPGAPLASRQGADLVLVNRRANTADVILLDAWQQGLSTRGLWTAPSGPERMALGGDCRLADLVVEGAALLPGHVAIVARGGYLEGTSCVDAPGIFVLLGSRRGVPDNPQLWGGSSYCARLPSWTARVCGDDPAEFRLRMFNPTELGLPADATNLRNLSARAVDDLLIISGEFESAQVGDPVSHQARFDTAIPLGTLRSLGDTMAWTHTQPCPQAYGCGFIPISAHASGVTLLEPAPGFGGGSSWLHLVSAATAAPTTRTLELAVTRADNRTPDGLVLGATRGGRLWASDGDHLYALDLSAALPVPGTLSVAGTSTARFPFTQGVTPGPQGVLVTTRADAATGLPGALHHVSARAPESIVGTGRPAAAVPMGMEVFWWDESGARLMSPLVR